MIEHQARMGDVLRRSLDRSGWRIVNKTPLPLVCFTRDGLDTSNFWPTSMSVRSPGCRKFGSLRAPVLRACVTSFRTTEAGYRVGRRRDEPHSVGGS